MPRLFDPAIFDGPELFDTSLRVTVVTFPTLPPTLESVLRTHHTPVARLLFLAADLETVLHEVPAKLIGGSVTMERSRDTHRSASVTLVNDDGIYTPASSSSLVWPNRLVRVERGAMVGSTAQYVPLITGIIDEPASGENQGDVSFSVWSRLQLADQQFSGPLVFAAGQAVGAVILAIAQLAGLGANEAFYSLTDGGQSLAEARTFDSADNMLGSMVRLAFDAGCDLYDDGAGVLIMHPFIDPATAASVWDFTPGADAVLISRTTRLKALPGVYNRAVVIGTGPDRYPIRAEARVTNPNDALYNPLDGSGPVGDRPRPPYISSNISTQQMASAVAQRLLIEGAMGEESSGAVTVPIPLLMQTGRPVVGYGAERHLLDRVSCPIDHGAMGLDSTRTRSLVA